MNRGNVRRAQSLRRGMTAAEWRLWSRLRGDQVQGLRFRRQEAIGPYIVDFVCRQRHLVIEVDGGQHADPGPREIQRTRYLEDRGFRILRFWNHDVLAKTDGAMTEIFRALDG